MPIKIFRNSVGTMKTGTLVGEKKTNILPITECFNLHSNVFQKKFLIKKKKISSTSILTLTGNKSPLKITLAVLAVFLTQKSRVLEFLFVFFR